MAVVTTALTATPFRTVIEKPPDMVREGTAIPRALVNFALQEATLTAKPVNDSQELIITCVLNPSFAYRLVDFTCSAIQDVANDWRSRGYLEVTNAIRGIPLTSQTMRHSVNLEDSQRNVSAIEMWIARAGRGDSFPAYIIQPAGGVVGFTFNANNQTAAVGAAGTIDFLASFLEYDIAQAYRYLLHSPQLVYER